MKTLWLHITRTYLKLGLFFYFKSINVYGKNNLPIGKPILFLSNHQNALLDALLIATTTGRFSYYLTRAAVFKKPLIRKILGTFNMLPVYRVRDGWNTISNNNSIFTLCAELLNKGQNICIFPEGSHNLKRTVRPLSKGFTRIVFGTLERFPDTDLQLVPIGLNFQNATGFPDSTSVYFGEAINASNYKDEDRNSGIVLLKKDVHQAISNLTTHIPSEDYEEIEITLQAMDTNYLDPTAVNKAIRGKINSYDGEKVKHPNFLKKVFGWLFSILIFGPFLLWKFIIKPRISEIEFMSTFRFAIGITLVPLWILIVSILAAVYFGAAIGVGLGLIIVLMALLATKL